METSVHIIGSVVLESVVGFYIDSHSYNVTLSLLLSVANLAFLLLDSASQSPCQTIRSISTLFPVYFPVAKTCLFVLTTHYLYLQVKAIPLGACLVPSLDLQLEGGNNELYPFEAEIYLAVKLLFRARL